MNFSVSCDLVKTCRYILNSSHINRHLGNIFTEYLSNDSTEAHDEGREDACDPDSHFDVSDVTDGRVVVLEAEPNERNLFLRLNFLEKSP